MFCAAAFVTLVTLSIWVGLLSFPTLSDVNSLRLSPIFATRLFTNSFVVQPLLNMGLRDLKACDVRGEVLNSFTNGFFTLINLVHECITFVCFTTFTLVCLSTCFIFFTDCRHSDHFFTACSFFLFPKCMQLSFSLEGPHL